MSARHAVSPEPSALRATLTLLRPHLRGSRRVMAGGIVAILVEVLARLLEPWPISWAIDTVVPSAVAARSASSTGGSAALTKVTGAEVSIGPWTATPTTLLLVAGGAVVVIAALRAAAAYLSTVAFAHTGAQVSGRLRAQVHDHLLSASTHFHAGARTGDLVTRVVSDVGRVQEAGVTAGLPLVANVATVIGMIVVVVFLDPLMGLLVIGVLPLLAISGRSAGAKITSASRAQRKREGELASDAAEAFTHIVTVQAYGLRGHLSKRFHSVNSGGLRDGVRAKRLSAGLERRTDLVVGFAVGAVLVLGGHRVLAGAISPGELVVFLTYLKTTFKPLRDLAKHTGRIARAAASGERIAATLVEAHIPTDPSWARPLPARSGDRGHLGLGAVELRSVTAGYGRGEPVLREACLQVPAGQRVALVGPSGAGKSTVFSLLMRFLEAESGSIHVDGHDIRDLTIDSVRDAVAVVLQDSAVLAGTLADNVRLGRLDADDEAVTRALRQAGLGELIDTDPDGILRVVGERGVTLSGGQRQRLAVARALVRDPRLVLLDEPATGLDAANIDRLLTALEGLCEGRTTILITHEAALLRLVDRIVEVRDGQLVDITGCSTADVVPDVRADVTNGSDMLGNPMTNEAKNSERAVRAGAAGDVVNGHVVNRSEVTSKVVAGKATEDGDGTGETRDATPQLVREASR